MYFSCFRDFEDGAIIGALGYEIVLKRRSLGSLNLPSGNLIACDPLTSLDMEPFSVPLIPGDYPVSLIMAELRDEVRVAYATIKLGSKESLRWEKALVGPAERPSIFDEIDECGYSVDSSIGCFTDADTAAALLDYHQVVLAEDNDFAKILHSRVRRGRRAGVGAALIDLKRDLKIPMDGSPNLIAFETGYGRGVYSTYLGRDADNEIVSIVTDFEVLDLRFPSFPFRGPRS